MFAERGQPDKDSVDAQEGQMLHESVWMKDKKIEALNLSLEQMQMIYIVQSCLKEIAVRYCVKEWIAEKLLTITKDDKILIFGTPDAYGIGTECAVCIDLKFGYKEVEKPEENLQLAAGAAAVHQATGLEKVVTIILQPRVNWKAYEPYTFTQFDNIINAIHNIVTTCNNPDADRCSGEWCQYCKAKPKCKEFKKMTTELTETKPSEITFTNADDIYIKACLVEKRMKEIKAECKQIVIDNGGTAGLLEINEKRGNRYIPDLQAAYDNIQHMMSIEEFLGYCSATIGKLEDAVARKIIAEKNIPIYAAKKEFNELAGVQHKTSTTEIKVRK